MDYIRINPNIVDINSIWINIIATKIKKTKNKIFYISKAETKIIGMNSYYRD